MSAFTKVKSIFAESSFLGKALDTLKKQPFLILVVVLVYAVLHVTSIVVRGNCSNALPMLELAILAFVVLGSIAAIVWCLEKSLIHSEKRLKYSQRTEEEFKKALREEVWRGQKEYPLQMIQVVNELFLDDREVRDLLQEFQRAYPEYILDFDSLAIHGKFATVCGLILYCHRRGVVDKLIRTIRHIRPDAVI